MSPTRSTLGTPTVGGADPSAHAAPSSMVTLVGLRDAIARRDPRQLLLMVRRARRQPARSLAKEYRAWCGRDLERDVRARFLGPVLGAIRLELEGDTVGADVCAVRTALWLGDRVLLRALLGEMSAERARALRMGYRQRYRRSLPLDALSGLSGRSRHDMQVLLRGRAESEEVAIARLEESWSRERRGLSNAPARIMLDAFSNRGRALDEAMAALRRASREHSGADVAALRARALDRQRAYEALRDRVRSWVSTAASIGASLGAAWGFARAGGPFLPRALFRGVVFGALARGSAEYVVGGQSVGPEGAWEGALVGASEGLAASLGAMVVAHPLGSALLGRSPMVDAARGSIMGLVGGGAGGALTTAARSSTWEDGRKAGARRVLRSFGAGAGSGFLLGGIVAGLTAALSRASVGRTNYLAAGQQGKGVRATLEELEAARQALATAGPSTDLSVAMERLESALRDPSVRVVESTRLGGGVEGSYLVKLSNGLKAVWKPSKGENWQLPYRGRRGLREAAAYLVDRSMGHFGQVPPTVFREFGGDFGSLQVFVEAKALGKASEPRKSILRVLDAVLGNPDRHGRNFVGDGIPIDHGLSLPHANRIHGRMAQAARQWLFADCMGLDHVKPVALSAEQREAVRRLASSMPELREALRTLGIERSAIRAMQARVDRILKAGIADEWWI